MLHRIVVLLSFILMAERNIVYALQERRSPIDHVAGRRRRRLRSSCVSPFLS